MQSAASVGACTQHRNRGRERGRARGRGRGGAARAGGEREIAHLAVVAREMNLLMSQELYATAQELREPFRPKWLFSAESDR